MLIGAILGFEMYICFLSFGLCLHYVLCGFTGKTINNKLVVKAFGPKTWLPVKVGYYSNDGDIVFNTRFNLLSIILLVICIILGVCYLL
jgi:hypothetical protein